MPKKLSKKQLKKTKGGSVKADNDKPELKTPDCEDLDNTTIIITPTPKKKVVDDLKEKLNKK